MLSFPSRKKDELSTLGLEDVARWIGNINEHVMQHGQEITLDYTPKVDMEFNSEKSAYDFYNDYAGGMVLASVENI